MILPNKYTTLTESFIGISALILNVLKNKKITIDLLWNQFDKKYIQKNVLKKPPTYQKFIYVLEYMFLTGMIGYNSRGELFNENITTHN